MMHCPTLQLSSLFERWHSLLTNPLLPGLKTGPQCWAPRFPSQGIHTFSLAFNSVFREQEDKPFTSRVVYPEAVEHHRATRSLSTTMGWESTGEKQSLTISPWAAAPGQPSPGLLAIASTFSCKVKAPQQTESLFGWLWGKLCMFKKINCSWLQRLPHVTLPFCNSTGGSMCYPALSASQDSCSLHWVLHWFK